MKSLYSSFNPFFLRRTKIATEMTPAISDKNAEKHMYQDEEKLPEDLGVHDEKSYVDPDVERSFVRRIDLMILPIVCTVNFMQVWCILDS